MSTQLSQIAKKAKLDRTVRFTSLAHLLTPEFLTETWGMMNRRAASGIDGEPDAGDRHVRLCVQRRLACSAGDKPAGVEVRAP